MANATTNAKRKDWALNSAHDAKPRFPYKLLYYVSQMPDIASIKQYDFPWPNDGKGYNIFPTDLENDPLVAFHGTSESSLNSIIQCGFKFGRDFPSISFAKTSALSLGYACSKRSETSSNGVVIAVKFKSLSQPGVVEEVSCSHLYCQDKQPEIIGYCIVPQSYVHS